MIGTAVGIFVVGLVEAGTLDKGGREFAARAASHERLLDYERFLKVVPFPIAFLMPIVFLTAILISSRAFQDLGSIRELDSSWPGFVFTMLFVGTLGLVLGIETLGTSFLVSQAGLRKRSVLSKDYFLGWDEVDSIEHSQRSQRILIRHHRGKLRLSLFGLEGLEHFARAILYHVPIDKWKKSEPMIFQAALFGLHLEMVIDLRDQMVTQRAIGSIVEVITAPRLRALVFRLTTPIQPRNEKPARNLLGVGRGDIVRDLLETSVSTRRLHHVSVFRWRDKYRPRVHRGNLPSSIEWLGRGEIRLLEQIAL